MTIIATPRLSDSMAVRTLGWKTETAARAADMALEHITRHGSFPGPKQQLALFSLLRVYSKMQFDLSLEHRVGVPFPTGFGKTTSIAAWIVALHAHRSMIATLDNAKVPTVTVSASRVEALCELKRDVMVIARHEEERRPGSIDLKTLEKSIGLLHSYRYDQEAVEEARANHREVPDGYASEPSLLSLVDAMERPYVLATHAMITGKASNAIKLSRYVTAKGDVVERGIVFWDESLIPGDTFTVDYNALVGTAQKLQWVARDRHGLREAADWAQSVAEVVQATFDDGDGSGICTLPEIEEERMLRIRAALKGKPDYSDVTAALAMAGMPARIIRRSDKAGGVVSFRPTIPNDIRRIVVLDASYPLSKLYEVDHRIKRFDHVPELSSVSKDITEDNLKTYEDVDIRYMKAGGGRSTVSEDAGTGSGTLIRDIVDVIVTQVQSDHSVLVYTYKHRDRREKNLPELILQALTEAGIDVDELVDVHGSGRRKRINVAHWGGSECGSNQFSHCHHVILAGIMHVPSDVHAANYLGAVDDLGADYTNEIAREVALSSRGHLAYQALSRGRSRSTTNEGKAFPMTAWIVDAEPKLLDELRKVLPLVKLCDWDGQYQKAKLRLSPETDAAYAKIVEYVKSLPDDIDRIKAARLWHHTGLDRSQKRVREDALSRFIEEAHGWIKNPSGYGLVRVGSGAAMGFTAVEKAAA